MNQDVSYWLAEVESLQQQLMALQKEREQAFNDALNWRQRYETEARQRRADLERADQAMAQLQTEINHLQGLDVDTNSEPQDNATLFNELAELDVAELAQQIHHLQKERDRLIATLNQERHNHEQTRQSLTLALGDAVDRLSKVKDSGKPAHLPITKADSDDAAISPAD